MFTLICALLTSASLLAQKSGNATAEPAGKSKKEIIAMMDDDQREMILQNMPTLHLSRVERRRMERGLRKKENVRNIRNG